jgi:hypothetical protein
VRRPEARKLTDVKRLLMGDDGLRAARHHDGTPVEFPDEFLVPDVDRAQIGCSLCGRINTLYENVTVRGWRSVTGHQIVEMDETVVVPSISLGAGALSREVEWDTAEHENYACSECNSGGMNEGTYLAQIALIIPAKQGTDGEPLRPVPPGQEKLEV